MSTKTAGTAGPGHNSGLDQAQEKAWVVNYPRLIEAEAQMAGMKGEIAGIYKDLERAGYTKDDIKWWKKVSQLNVGEVIETYRRRIGLARLMGHQFGRQADLFEKDRTPVEDVAYAEGHAAGLMRRSATNPYGMETVAGQNWQKGFNEGHAEQNRMLEEALNENLIKTGDDDEEYGSIDDDEWDAADPDSPDDAE